MKFQPQQSQPTVTTQQKLTKLLDYVSCYPNAVIRFHASDMCLHVDLDVAYLVLTKARSRLAGHSFLSDHPEVSKTISPNGPKLT